MNRLIAVAALLLGCNEGHPQFLNADLAQPPVEDMAAPADMPPASDMPSGPTCGDLVMCVVQMCGLTDLQCSAQCFQGAQPAAIQQAGALVLCAATQCLFQGGDGGGGGGLGGGNMLELFQCLLQSCGEEVGACDGLPFSGF